MVLLVATVALVCLSSAEGMAPPEEVLDLHGERQPPGMSVAGLVLTRESLVGDHHGAMELGEAKQGKVAKTVGVVAPEDPTKQNTLKVIEKLMEAPIIDPRQEKSYKAAAQQVESVKQHIKNDLMKVVKMEILSQRVSELDAKKAMGLATDADRWLMNGEKSMDGAVESSGGQWRLASCHSSSPLPAPPVPGRQGPVFFHQLRSSCPCCGRHMLLTLSPSAQAARIAIPGSVQASKCKVSAPSYVFLEP